MVCLDVCVLCRRALKSDGPPRFNLLPFFPHHTRTQALNEIAFIP